MFRVDGYYLYNLGANLSALKSLTNETKSSEALLKLYIAETHLREFLYQSVFRVKTSLPKGRELLVTLENARSEAEANLHGSPSQDSEIGWRVYTISAAVTTFEAVLAAELGFSDLFIAPKRGAFDTSDLTENGQLLFASELQAKVPAAIPDVKQAGRCIAFDLPTAAAFHLHRANEIVLRQYYDTVTGGKPHPERPTIPKYIDAMKGYQVGNAKVFGALATLNNLHRNPVLHPEVILESIEEAIAILGSVNAVVTYMLKELAPQQLKLEQPPSAETEEPAGKT